MRLANLTEVSPQNTQLRQAYSCCGAQLGDLNQTTTKSTLQKLKKLNKQPSLAEIKLKLWTQSCEGSGGSALIDTPNIKHTKSVWIGITSYISAL